MRSRLRVMSSDQSVSLSTTVGLIRMISSRFSVRLLVCPKNRLDIPGNPDSSPNVAWRIRPPMTTICPSRARTMLSVSDMELEASGSLSVPFVPPIFTVFSTVLTKLTDGWTCRMISLFSSMRGVTSSAMPEKNGCKVTVGVVVVAVPVVVVLETLVTKNSSVPTFSTAFWLFRVAMRGLDSTCTLPCVSRKFSSAAKLLAWKARPNNDPAPLPEARLTPGVEVIAPLVIAPAVAKVDPGDSCPTEVRRLGPFLNAAQFTPDWKLSFNVTSMILASRMTCRSMEICEALR